MVEAPPAPRQPDRDCSACPRLVAFRTDNRAKFPDFFNAPVPSFGPMDARLLLVGMAPGLKGANRTGRPFTGDYAGDLLFETLIDFGFATGDYGREPDDGLTLVDARLTNAARCVPPQNKLIGAEVTACRPFLTDEIRSLPGLTAIVAIGGDAHRAVLAALGLKQSAFAFGHGSVHILPDGAGLPGPVRMVDSYHCSRYNTNTGRLTRSMFRSVFATVRGIVDG